MDFAMELRNGDKVTVQTNQIIHCLRNGVQLDKEYLADVIEELAYKACGGEYYKRKYETEAERAKIYKKQAEELKKENERLKITTEAIIDERETIMAEYVSTLKKKHDMEVKDLKDKIHTAKTLNKFYRHELKRRGVKFIKMDDGFGHHVNIINGAEIDGNYLIRTASMTEEELDSADNE